MLRCKICNAPLSGFLGFVSRMMGRKPSADNPELCSVCAGKDKRKNGNGPFFVQSPSGSEKEYQCRICGRMVKEKHALEHVQAEEYLINLIQKDHPNWEKDTPVCKKCLEYYRTLVKDAEI